MKNVFGIRPGNIFLYKLAFKHRSTGQETINGYTISNERLEFLGDAILDAVVADYLFKKFPLKDEGFLTETRSKIVSRNQLNRLSQKIGMTQLIEIESNSGHQFKSFAGDAFEAFVGALYLDKGYTATRKILVERIIKTHLDVDQLILQEMNFKSKMLEYAQKEKKQLKFNVAGENGNGYKKQYIVEVLLNDIVMATGTDYSIKGAEQSAAEKACQAIQSKDPSAFTQNGQHG